MYPFLISSFKPSSFPKQFIPDQHGLHIFRVSVNFKPTPSTKRSLSTPLFAHLNMAGSDAVFRFVPNIDSSADMRTFRVLQLLGNASEELELYKFSHPLTGHSTGTTTFHRKNLDTSIFETAGHVEWFSSFNATVWFGVDECPVKDLRKTKNDGHSRRFKAGGMEYKWKLDGNGADMFCIDSKDKHVAHWSAGGKKLNVSSRYVAILDRIVVTCFLNLWFQKLGKW